MHALMCRIEKKKYMHCSHNTSENMPHSPTRIGKNYSIQYTERRDRNKILP